MKLNWQHHPRRLSLNIADLVVIRLQVGGPSRWPPWTYPEASISLRWGMRHGHRVWRHYQISGCDLGAFSVSTWMRRLHVCLGLVHVGIDLPVSVPDRVLFRWSLWDVVASRRARRK